jgi:hypothetical protein
LIGDEHAKIVLRASVNERPGLSGRWFIPDIRRNTA